MMRIYLASQSPRRQELLRQVGVEFVPLPMSVPEGPRAGEAPPDYVLRVAREKARMAYAEMSRRALPPLPVLGADTAVVVDGDILGKPTDRPHGLQMLRRLSGRPHEVLTGICLIHRAVGGETPREQADVSESRVYFGEVDDDAAAWYWGTGEPLDKAGGYAIQGLGARFVARLEGSYSGVMGLPLFELTRLLQRIES